ncbi:hypothetical protein F4861DRAFT_197953 [Xylaria intraflava]|nr:hypothetical protein F4861DRAFT_197953 [Xylaria intraflava]
MGRLDPNRASAARPVSWSTLPADDPAAHEQIIKFISESIVDDIQSNISSGFMRQVHASKKSAISPHDKAERMHIVRDMRTTLERLTEELGQKFFEEYRHRPAVGRWYDSWLFNDPPTFLRWEQEWAFTPDETLVMSHARSSSGSIDGRLSGSGTTPEVRVDFEEDLDDSEDTQDYSQVPEYRPDAPVTEKKTDSSAPSSTRCQCNYAEGESSDSGGATHLCQTCACSDQGQGCTASCGCDETCQNNFNNPALDNILRTDASGRADFSTCFITYLQKLELAEPISLEYLFDQLLTGLDYVPDGNDEAIDAWRAEWETGYNGPDLDAKIEALQRDLIHLGLGADRGDKRRDWFFSFCYNNNERIGSWQQGQQIWHCRDCRQCIDRQAWWHCEQCNKCQYGRTAPCGDCGGVSDSYHENHNGWPNPQAEYD